jgi:His/Glu/Gln/Arg/opine family amino acid ABC transporter permease subunit
MFGLDLTFLDWDILRKFVLGGFWFSVQLTLVATLGGVLVGTLLALMRLSGKPMLMLPATIYVNGMRSVPLVMVILWFFLLVPSAFYNYLPDGANHRAEYSAFITFIAFEAAYFSEIMRAGIRAGVGHDLWAEHAPGGAAAGVSQHAAGAAHADHHPVPGHFVGLCNWCLRPAQGLHHRRQDLRPTRGGVLAGRRGVFCDLLCSVMDRQTAAGQDSHRSLSAGEKSND